MRAIFVYSDNVTKQITFPSMLGVKRSVGKFLTEPIICYFEGRLTPEQEKSVPTCMELTRWQHWCLRQTRTYEE